MAEQETKVFPLIPVKHWWALRKRFQQSIPGVVTDNYLATVLSMQAVSARANVLPSLKRMRIIDDEGRPTDLAKKWRDDSQYAQVCKAIRQEVYPQELSDAVPNAVTDRDSVETWFANHTGAGRVAVQRMAACYVVLCEGDPAKAPELGPRQRVSAEKRTTPPKRYAETRRLPERIHQRDEIKHNGWPELCINLQVHISADASGDQIDQIFASMAKHIYGRTSHNE